MTAKADDQAAWRPPGRQLTLIFTAILAGGCAAYQRSGAATGGGGAVAMGG